jgi:hypothetical protein
MLEIIIKILPFITLSAGILATYRYIVFKKYYEESLNAREDEYQNYEPSINYEFKQFELPKANYSSYFFDKARQYKLIAVTSFIATILLFILLTSFDKKPDIRQNLLDALVKGKMAYDIPTEMKVGDTYDATVSITKSLNDSILFSTLDTLNFTKQEIRVSSRVKVLLIDPRSDYFKIMNLNTDEQLVDDSSNTIWKWKITPLEPGHNKIVVRVSARILNNIGDNYKDIPVFEQTIVVTSTIPKAVWHFIKTYWYIVAFILTAILFPTVKWLWKVYSSRREKKKNKRPPIGFNKSGT